MDEIPYKLELIRKTLAETGAEGARFRSPDWFAWASGGADSSVLFSADEGVAEILVTKNDFLLLASRIEEPRMRAEFLPPGARLESYDWAEPEALEKIVARHGKRFLSDRPRGAEEALPGSLKLARWRLHPAEIERYRALGADAASAARQALHEISPDKTEWEVAGAAARALWSRGIHPLLTLVGGERRVLAYRHPVASGEKVGLRAMLVICGRRHGLFANLTRHVFFRSPTSEEREFTLAAAEVEAAAWKATGEGLPLAEIFGRIRDMYRKLGFPGQEEVHHQGGPCGYLSRELVVTPSTDPSLRAEPGMAFAWNPSLPGAKIEDTVLRGEKGHIEVLTEDPQWPSFRLSGHKRPDLWVRA